MVVCINRLQHKITIQKLLQPTADGHGHVDPATDANWGTYCTSWAAVVSKGGREFWKVQQTAADVSHVWNCPYASALAAATPDMRLIHEGLTYQILSVIDIDLAHDEIEIQTRRAT